MTFVDDPAHGLSPDADLTESWQEFPNDAPHCLELRIPKASVIETFLVLIILSSSKPINEYRGGEGAWFFKSINISSKLVLNLLLLQRNLVPVRASSDCVVYGEWQRCLWSGFHSLTWFMCKSNDLVPTAILAEFSR